MCFAANQFGISKFIQLFSFPSPPCHKASAASVPRHLPMALLCHEDELIGLKPRPKYDWLCSWSGQNQWHAMNWISRPWVGIYNCNDSSHFSWVLQSLMKSPSRRFPKTQNGLPETTVAPGRTRLAITALALPSGILGRRRFNPEESKNTTVGRYP
jgi:hypothetical protein